MTRTLVPALLVAALAGPARAEKLVGPITSEQSAAGWRLLESNNGAAARGCLSERAVYEAFHRTEPALAWNPDNPADWYLSRNTLGLVVGILNDGYGEISRLWNSSANGTDFAAIGAPCRAEKTPRGLAACLNDKVRAYFAAHPNLHAFSGGDCKLYSATLVRVSESFPAVARQSAIVSSLHHAVNKLSIRDAQGREHVFLIDSLNNLVVQLSDERGGCPDEGTLAAGAAADGGSRREADALARQRAALERVRRAEGASPAP